MVKDLLKPRGDLCHHHSLVSEESVDRSTDVVIVVTDLTASLKVNLCIFIDLSKINNTS